MAVQFELGLTRTGKIKAVMAVHSPSVLHHLSSNLFAIPSVGFKALV